MGLEMQRMDRNKQKSPIRAWLPVLGLILGLCVAVLAWVASPAFASWLDGQSNRWPPELLTDMQVRLFSAAVLFATFMILAWAIVAAFIPKQKSRVTEKDLVNSRKEIHADKAARKKRVKKMRQAALDENRKNTKK